MWTTRSSALVSRRWRCWVPAGRASCARDRCGARRTTVRRRLDVRRSDTPPEGDPSTSRSRAPVAAHDCAPRPARWRGRWQTPPGAATRTDREQRCTTALRPETDGPRATNERRCHGRGCARSSRQTVPALGAACLQHTLASAGAHPLTKAVLLRTTTVVGLERALHAILLTGHRTTVQADRGVPVGCGTNPPPSSEPP